MTYAGSPATVVTTGPPRSANCTLLLLVGADQAIVGDNIDLRYETDDPTRQHAKSAMGAGFGVGLLVENGKLGPGAANERDVAAAWSSAFAPMAVKNPRPPCRLRTGPRPGSGR